MPKKNRKASSGLGKTLIKDHKTEGLNKIDGWLHTSELSDGYDWGRLNLTSVTEENHLDEFLRIAELAGTEFTAEKLQISVVTDTGIYTGLPQAQEKMDIEKAQREHRQLLSIPRRPTWDSSTTSEQLEIKERESFLEWRRLLAALQENDKLTMTPFERNLVFWRQLWRVIERSDIIVQIVDARNPLLFRCEDLEKYVKEIDQSKKNVILMSKCDLLTSEQRAIWLKYFQSHNISVAFWSSKAADEMNNLENHEDNSSHQDNDSNHQSDDTDDESADEQDYLSSRFKVINQESAESDNDLEDVENSEDEDESSEDKSSDVNPNQVTTDVTSCHDHNTVDNFETCIDEKTSELRSEPLGTTIGDEPLGTTVTVGDEPLGTTVTVGDEPLDTTIVDVEEKFTEVEMSECNESDNQDKKATPLITGNTDDECRLLSCEELLKFFCDLYPKSHATKADCPLTIGMVGYPNVGKSSTINSLLKIKKVPVSATPGRTKHFQTLFVDDNILLCDCPGLVFPNFISTKADMVCNGILPIDQMRDHVPPVSLVCSRIPREVLEQAYGIMMPPPREGEDPFRPPYSHELLSEYGYTRGFMTAHGLPDQARSSRYILKDYVNGTKLLYCEPPPGIDPDGFNTQLKVASSTDAQFNTKANSKLQKPPASVFDREFFKQPPNAIYRKVMSGTSHSSAEHPNRESNATEKPWRKHNNKNRKNKIRRVVGKNNDGYEY